MSLLRDIERRIDDRLRRFFQSEPVPGQGRELVEIQRMVLDQIEARVQMLPRARRAFPFNEVAVRIPAANADKKAAIESVFAADDALKAEIIEHLERERIEYPPDLQVSVTAIDTAEVMEPSVVCRKREIVNAAAKQETSGTVQFTLPDGSTSPGRRGRGRSGPRRTSSWRRCVRPCRGWSRWGRRRGCAGTSC